MMVIFLFSFYYIQLKNAKGVFTDILNLQS